MPPKQRRKRQRDVDDEEEEQPPRPPSPTVDILDEIDKAEQTDDLYTFTRLLARCKDTNMMSRLVTRCAKWQRDDYILMLAGVCFDLRYRCTIVTRLLERDFEEARAKIVAFRQRFPQAGNAFCDTATLEYLVDHDDGQRIASHANTFPVQDILHRALLYALDRRKGNALAGLASVMMSTQVMRTCIEHGADWAVEYVVPFIKPDWFQVVFNQGLELADKQRNPDCVRALLRHMPTAQVHNTAAAVVDAAADPRGLRLLFEYLVDTRYAHTSRPSDPEFIDRFNMHVGTTTAHLPCIVARNVEANLLLLNLCYTHKDLNPRLLRLVLRRFPQLKNHPRPLVAFLDKARQVSCFAQTMTSMCTPAAVAVATEQEPCPLTALLRNPLLLPILSQFNRRARICLLMQRRLSCVFVWQRIFSFESV